MAIVSILMSAGVIVISSADFISYKSRIFVNKFNFSIYNGIYVLSI